MQKIIEDLRTVHHEYATMLMHDGLVHDFEFEGIIEQLDVIKAVADAFDEIQHKALTEA
jgi:hypothetical protein